MKIRITLATAKDEDQENLIYSFLEILFDAIEEELHYLPSMDINGRKRLVVYFFNLSKREADIILKLVQPERTGRPESLITNLTISQPKEENPTDLVFIFSPPGFRTKEDEERAAERNKHGIDVSRVIRKAQISVDKAFYDMFMEKHPDWDTPPLTTLAYIHNEIETEPEEDRIARRIAGERMPRLRKKKKPQIKKPRAPRKRNAAKDPAAAELREASED